MAALKAVVPAAPDRQWTKSAVTHRRSVPVGEGALGDPSPARKVVIFQWPCGTALTTRPAPTATAHYLDISVYTLI